MDRIAELPWSAIWLVALAACLALAFWATNGLHKTGDAVRRWRGWLAAFICLTVGPWAAILATPDWSPVTNSLYFLPYWFVAVGVVVLNEARIRNWTPRRKGLSIALACAVAIVTTPIALVATAVLWLPLAVGGVVALSLKRPRAARGA